MSEPAKTPQGRRTRERLVAGAAELIREQGVERTSLDQILARTRTSKGQLYHYFADRDALVREVIAFQTAAVLEQTVEAAGGIDSWTALRRWFDTLVTAQERDDCRHGCPVGSLASELSHQDGTARAELARSFEQWQRVMEAVFDRLRAKGRLRPGADTRAMATATLASIQGGLLLSTTFRNPEPLRCALSASYAHLRTFAAQNESSGGGAR